MSSSRPLAFLVGNGTLQVESPRQPRLGGKFHAVSQPVKGGPVRIFTYEDTPAGRKDMASLLRGENVIGLIYGESVEIVKESVITVTHGEDRLVDRLKLE